MDENVILKMKDNVVFENVDQDAVLFNPDNNCIINLNRTASRICELLRNRIKFSQLVDKFYELLVDEGKPSKDAIEKDISGVIEILGSKDMLEVEKVK